MKSLEDVFDEQASVLRMDNEEDSHDETVLIRFVANGSHYAVEIEKVIEVTEMLRLIPYPESFQGHIGVANLRGNIVPVVELEGALGQKFQEDRLLVLEFKPGQRFSTPVSLPKKVALDEREISEQGTVSIGGLPVQLIGEANFPALISNVVKE